ncbi:MAG: hypothetical protein HQL38_16625 [Alphaproteobacteria bacterium]|nr:hypothetical protein [Alphaproteobacteria bacterium]
MLDIATATIANFSNLVGQTFTLSLDGGNQVALTLTEAKPLKSVGQIEECQRDPFSLIFTAAGALDVPQNCYSLKNDSLGGLDIFLVQLSPTTFQAVFN